MQTGNSVVIANNHKDVQNTNQDTEHIDVRVWRNVKIYFTDCNVRIVKKLQLMCNHYNIPFEEVAPYTIKGVQKIIGLWDYEFKVTYDFGWNLYKCYLRFFINFK